MGFRQKRCQRRTASESAFESQPPSVDTYDPDQVAEVMFTTMFPPGADRMALANMINRAEAIGMAPTDMTPEGDAAVRGVVDSLVRCVLIVEPDWPEDFARAVVGARVARLQSYGSTEPIDLGSRTGGEPGLQPPDDSSQPDLSEKGARRPLHAVHPRDRRQAVARAHSGDAVVGAAIAGAAEMAHAARSGDACRHS